MNARIPEASPLWPGDQPDIGWTPDTQPWMADGLCRSIGFDIFFPTTGGPTAQAKRVCLGCPVRVECLEYALAWEEHPDSHGFRHGIWGGTSPAQRRQLALRRQQEEVAA